MSEKYRGRIDDRRYTSDAVDVTYNLVRCIHAAECVRRLNEVFDTNKRPWIQPANSAADSIVYTVAHCPSGALHTERNDGGKGEEIPTENIIVVHNDSYYEFKGDIEIQGSNVAIEQEIRAALCRCGLSQNKPFCDNSHRNSFSAPSSMVDKEITKTEQTGGKLIVKLYKNGSIECQGNFEIRDPRGNTIYRGTSTYLCRCGHSNSKPFCDATHKKIDFTAP